MINMANRTDVAMRLGTVKLFLRHFVVALHFTLGGPLHFRPTALLNSNLDDGLANATLRYYAVT